MTKRTQVLMAFNHAGGAAKTSTVRDVGYDLAQRGFKVLLIDLDPQANLSQWLGQGKAELEESVKNSLEHYTPLPKPTEVHGMSLIPSHLELSYTDMALGGYPNAEGRLRRAVDQLREEGTYDFILLDPPPSLGKLTANAANAADWVIVPIPARYKGIVALRGVQRMLEQYGYTNPNLRIALYVITQMDNTSHAKEAVEVYQEALGDQLAGLITHRPAVYNRCQPEGRPVGAIAADAEAKEEIRLLVDQLLSRIGAGA
ncbi:ParA family protein [Deinococcus sp. Marseille-Q6407]|uniref:ParA family protein n=1 Tax=Deinococcus sp. Marseille-Q6407 TaxID=2969223 RepID=UPI0021C1B824|nr:ParA family protein [Deinococcus sp. Marseille-Q6407]